jgi:hypothetical protein
MPEHSFPLERKVPRFSFIAEAEVTALRNGTRLVARVSELSLRGCYVDTPEAFPVGTELRLRIRYGGSTCELSGKAIYTHNGWGMGVLFGEMAAEQRSIVNLWLAELARKSEATSLPSTAVICAAPARQPRSAQPLVGHPPPRFG